MLHKMLHLNVSICYVLNLFHALSFILPIFIYHVVSCVSLFRSYQTHAVSQLKQVYNIAIIAVKLSWLY